MNDDFATVILCVFIFFISFIGGSINEACIMEKQAVKTHNAHYVLNETNGTSTFQWNNK
jgi:hypothetical protein